MEKFKYYVVYFYNSKAGWSVGRCFIERAAPIETEDDIVVMQHAVEDNGARERNSVTLLNWKRIS